MPATAIEGLRSETVGIEVESPLLGGGTRQFVNLDNASSTPTFRPVMNKVDEFMRFYSNVARGTGFKAPPAGYGDYAFILHILASLTDDGRAGIVCPQGVLFRGQPEVEEETGEFDDDGNPKMKRRKADDEHLIRKALLGSRLIDAVISLPLNVFYGAGVPACLLILRKQRSAERRDQVLLIYAARHYRELSAQNELRPQDLMRMLIHYHAYGDAAKVPELVAQQSGRIRRQIDLREEDEVGRLEAEYRPHADKLAVLDAELADARTRQSAAQTMDEKAKAAAAVARVERRRAKVAAKVTNATSASPRRDAAPRMTVKTSLQLAMNSSPFTLIRTNC